MKCVAAGEEYNFLVAVCFAQFGEYLPQLGRGEFLDFLEQPDNALGVDVVLLAQVAVELALIAPDGGQQAVEQNRVDVLDVRVLNAAFHGRAIPPPLLSVKRLQQAGQAVDAQRCMLQIPRQSPC